MTLQSYNWNWTGSGVLVDLGTTDDVYVGEDGFLSSSDARTIKGYGSNHSASIHGEVAGYYGGIGLGDSQSTDFGEEIFVAKHAKVSGDIYAAMWTQGYDSSIINNGIARGSTGVEMYGDSGFTTSTLLNRGRIIGEDSYGVYRNGTEDFDFTNKGTVSGGAGIAYYGGSSGDQTITNTGKMLGAVYFGSGDDVYNGTGGKVTGIVYGLDGDDQFTGGNKSERFEGDAGRDTMSGGGGADTFVFATVGDSTLATAGRDLIQSFNQGQHDQIDLSAIDAKLSTVLDDKFKFIGTDSFDGHEGQLRYYNAGGHTFIQGDNNGDGTADFAIELDSNLSLHKTDFVL